MDAAQHFQGETGGGHDDVGLESLARAKLKARLGEGVDLVGDDRRLAGADGLKEVAVGSHAEALVPGVVGGREVLADVVVRAKLLAYRTQDLPFHELGPSPRERVEEEGQEHVLPAREPVCETVRQPTMEPSRE